MIAISLDPGGLHRAETLFSSSLEGHVRDGFELTLESIAARAKQTTTFVDRTGALRNSIQSDGVAGSLAHPDGMVGTVSFAAVSERRLARRRGSGRRRRVGGFPYGLSLEYGSRTGIRERRFIRDAIAAESGDFLEDAVAATFREAGFEVR